MYLRAIEKLLLDTTPRVIDLSLGQSNEERNKAVSDLAPHESTAILTVLTKNILSEANINLPDPTPSLLDILAVDENSLYYDDEWRALSYDWRLRVAESEEGRFYDFNGWPGDNELGGGWYYPTNGEAIMVFENKDTQLDASDPAYTNVVSCYEDLRIQY